MKSLNRAELIGYVGKDPELKSTPSGIPVVTFSIATTTNWKDADGVPQERTEWHNLVAWRKLAEVINEWVKKGHRLYVSGALQTRSWEDKETKKKVYRTEIVLDDVVFLTPKEGNGGREEEAVRTPASSGEVRDDSLPF